jgi:hypothetical protein
LGSVAQALLLAQRYEGFTLSFEGPVRLCYGNFKKLSHLALSLTIEFLIANILRFFIRVFVPTRDSLLQRSSRSQHF